MLRDLWETAGAEKLDQYVGKAGSIRPRCVTATQAEVRALIDNAGKTLHLFLLLCSDLGIRSGTAVKIAPDNYNPITRELRFKTKYDEKVGLTVTEEVAETLESCDLSSDLPFLTQLRREEEPRAARSMKHDVVCARRMRLEMRRLRQKLGITKRIIPHDLRRTLAVNLYRRTGNIRTVQAAIGHHSLQSTFWYLDHDLEHVDVKDLEAIKGPYLVRKQGEA